jgi:hypothetical protein
MGDDPESRSAAQHVLEALVVTPVGIAADLGRAGVDLARRGRRQLSDGVATDDVVAGIAAQLAHLQDSLCATLRALGLTPPGGTSGHGTAAHEDAPSSGTRSSSATARDADGADGGRPPADTTAAGNGAPAARTTAASSSPTGGTTGAESAPDAPAAVDLAIPDYDNLSASQVVPRLAGLTAAELEDVRRYENAKRNRKTILNKIAQLQAR